MKKQIPVLLLGAACIVLGIAYVRSTKTVDDLRDRIVELESANKVTITNAIPEAATASALAPERKLSLPEPAMESTPEPAKEPAAETDRESGRRMMESLSKMMDNPTMNQMMEASQRGAIGALYTDLIAYLNLNDEETKYFMDLLMYRQMKQMDLGMKLMSGSLSAEEEAALRAEAKQAEETVKDEIEKFLNSEKDFAEFEYYEKTMGERMMLSQMDKDLAGSDSELSDTTYRDLLGVMHDERESFDFTSNLGDQENKDMSPERFSKENVQNYANDIQKLNENIFQQARAILTPEQYEAFVSSLKTFTDMQLAQLEMAAQMFGGGE